jgi:hypothetical protein
VVVAEEKMWAAKNTKIDGMGHGLSSMRANNDVSHFPLFQFYHHSIPDARRLFCKFEF